MSLTKKKYMDIYIARHIWIRCEKACSWDISFDDEWMGRRISRWPLPNNSRGISTYFALPMHYYYMFLLDYCRLLMFYDLLCLSYSIFVLLCSVFRNILWFFPDLEDSQDLGFKLLHIIFLLKYYKFVI